MIHMVVVYIYNCKLSVNTPSENLYLLRKSFFFKKNLISQKNINMFMTLFTEIKFAQKDVFYFLIIIYGFNLKLIVQ